MNKLLSREKVVAVRSQAKKDRKRVVFTNGCFDIIHPGHIGYLRKARALGDLLIVAINSDRSIKKLKGPLRPILTEAERGEILSGLEMVDCVTIFDDETPQEIISDLLPDILVKGGDWSLDQIIGRREVEAAGGRVLSLPYLQGSSTSDIIERILIRYQLAK